MSYRLRATGEDLLLVDRMKSLVFGIYAWPDDDGWRKVKEAGSGIFIAPRLGLIAKHVARSFQRLDGQTDAFNRRKSPLDSQYRTVEVKSEHAVLVYQVTGNAYLPSPDQHIRWKINVNWPSHDTDINVVELEPSSPAAESVEREQRYFDWYLKPPPKGAFVRVYGFPKANLEVEGEDHLIDVGLEVAVCRVTDHHYPFHDHGMVNFPVFELNRELDAGFSGGPVLWNDKLVGTFSGPSFVTTLWPTVLLTYPSVSTSGADVAFADHFNENVIHALDWNEVRGRVERAPCRDAVAGTDHLACHNSHAVLV